MTYEIASSGPTTGPAATKSENHAFLGLSAAGMGMGIGLRGIGLGFGA